MVKLNNGNSKYKFLAAQKSHSNTHLFLHLPITLSTNSFNSFLSTLNKAKISFNLLNIHLDNLRISTNSLTKKSFNRILADLSLPIPYCENKKPWHPDSKMPKSKKYQNSLRSDKGIILGYTKRLLNNSKKPKYVYDIMIEFYGSYFANLSLLEQLNLVNYLNRSLEPKCHRIDVAIDDYSKKLFPILQMLVAIDSGDYFGFKKVDEEYLYCTSEGCLGTLYLCSRLSEFFVRLYTSHEYFDRWETELKRGKAKKLFVHLASLVKESNDEVLSMSDILKALVNDAFGKIDFRDKSKCMSPSNATREKTNRLPFFQKILDIVYSSTANIADNN